MRRYERKRLKREGFKALRAERCIDLSTRENREMTPAMGLSKERYLSSKRGLFRQLRIQGLTKAAEQTEVRGVPAMVHSRAIIWARAWEAVLGSPVGAILVEDCD